MLQTNTLRIAFFGLFSALVLAAPAFGQEAASYDLTPHSGAQAQRVQIITEIRGDLKVKAPESGVDTLPLSVNAEMLYEERTLAWDETGCPAHTARHYHKAQAEMQVGSSTDRPTLPEDRRLVSVDLTGEKPLLTSPNEPLTRDELELIDLPTSSALAPRLLPGRAVTIGESWTHENDLLAALMNIDAITQAEVSSTLLEVVEDEARCELVGVISGAADGVATEIELRGRYTFNLASGQLTWLAVIVQEDRSIGHATPGYKVTSRIRMLLAPLEAPVVLTEETVAIIPTAAGPGLDLLTYRSSEGGYLIMHDRRWRVMVDNSVLSVLRLVDRGELVAQCNIVRLPSLPAGEQLEVEAFQVDVQNALGDRCEQIVEAADEVTPEGLHVIRVMAAGTVEGLPIHWIYYHITDQEGRRGACVFTLESNKTETFAAADVMLTSSFRFLAEAEGGMPRPAPESAEASDAPASSAPAPPSHREEPVEAPTETQAELDLDLDLGLAPEPAATEPARAARRQLNLRR